MEENDAREEDEESAGERERVEWKRKMQDRGEGEGGMEENDAREEDEESAGEMKRVEWKRRMQGKEKKSQQGRGRGWNGRERCTGTERRVSRLEGEGGMEGKDAKVR